MLHNNRIGLGVRSEIWRAGTQQQTKVIVVAGGAGFLGSQLCDRFVSEGHTVVCVDNLLTGRRENIAHLMKMRNFTFRLHDIIEPFQIFGPIDEIYNMACAASPPKYQIDPVHTFKTSVIGAINLLNLALERNAKILQASTSEVYGDPEISPQPEGYHGNVNTFGPRSCYDEGKRAAETLFHDYCERMGVATKIARIFNTYGPHMSPDDGRVVSNFINQAIKGEDITVYGAGNQTRSFCFSSDLLDGLVALMATPKDVSYPVNIGNPKEFTIMELAAIVIQKTGSKSRIVHKDLPVDDPRQRRPDISLAYDVLGWEPKIALDEGLDATIAYFMDEMQHPNVQEARVS